MRITNNMILSNTKGNINSNKLLVDKYNTQMTTQKKISKASENPVIAIRSLRLSTTMSQINQFADNNIPDAVAWMNVTENALTNMKDILIDIRTQCVNGSTDTLTSDDRQTLLDNLKALSEQVYSEGNAEYAGKSVFTGYRTSDTLTFQDDEPETTYEITQNFDFSDLEEKRYYTGDVQIPEAITANTVKCDTKISENSFERVRLAYNGDVNIDSFTVSYKDDNGNTQNVATNLVTYETEKAWEEAKQAAGEEGRVVGDDEVIFIEETGEFIFGKNVANTISDNKADIQVEYTKKGFANGEAKPYYYYDCRDITDDDPRHHVSYTKEDQDINYTTASNTVTTINTQAEQIFDTEIQRDVNEMINVIQRSINANTKVEKLKVMMQEAQYQDEASQEMLQGYLDVAQKEADFADDNVQKTYEHYITRFDGYMESVNIAIIDVGSKQNSLALTKVRVENQQTTIEELKSNNEDRDISDIIIDYYASYNAYTSSLTAAGKLNESNLLQYI
ncbi:MAG: flagellar biosynthesis protein FlgL [Agathobacter sp.]|nr:flagellar biosynthesis protein FlgL [Agathobacter sp.]